MTPRAAFLRSLPGCGFAPPEADVAGVGGDLPAGAAADRFAADVRAFAAEYWSLPPPDRRARWGTLTARAAGPAAAWLGELRHSLDETAAAPADPAAAELAALARELVVLPPRARAARRAAWLTARAADLPRYAAAAAGVRLDRQLSGWLARGVAPERIDRQTWLDILRRRRARRRAIDRFVNPRVTPGMAVVIALGLSGAMWLVSWYNAEPNPPRRVSPVTRSTEWSRPGGVP